MKRTALVLLSAALVGCQSPGRHQPAGIYSTQGYGKSLPKPVETGPYQINSREAGRVRLTNQDVARAAKFDPNLKTVGYSTGHGAMQNKNFMQRVARAVPSYGGAMPGAPGCAPGMGPMGPGMGPGMGRPGMGGPGCGAPGMLPPGMGGMPGMGGGMPGMGGPGCPPGMGMGPGSMFGTGRTQVHFVRPLGMKIAWQSDIGGGLTFTEPQLTIGAQDRYNFRQGQIYRLKLTDLESRPDLALYPTLEIYPGTPKTQAYLAHHSVPIDLTDEDLDQVQAGNFVTKVIYLPDPEFQELAIAGVETLVSTRLDPGTDPVEEAHRRGAILAVLRLGNVNLQLTNSPALLVGQGGPAGMPFVAGPGAPVMPKPEDDQPGGSATVTDQLPAGGPETNSMPMPAPIR